MIDLDNWKKNNWHEFHGVNFSGDVFGFREAAIDELLNEIQKCYNELGWFQQHFCICKNENGAPLNKCDECPR